MSDGQRISPAGEETNSQKSNNKQIDNKNVRGYIPRKCDLKCYKCHYQGICIVPRSLISALGRYVRGNKHFPNNGEFGLNGMDSVLLNLENYGKTKPLISGPVTLKRKFPRYRKRSKYEK